MADFFLQYGLFLAETITFVIAALVIIGGIFAAKSKGKDKSENHISIEKINDHYQQFEETLNEQLLDKKQRKQLQKQKKADAKKKAKLDEPSKRIFVINFDGDIKASDVDSLREEISAILTVAKTEDEVLLNLESAGGMVHSYGLAASQLQRLKDKNIPLTIAIDKVAASGGYMMACVADKIIAAPFAIVGSIGVVAQLPNFSRLLKKHDIDFEQITAGEYKRTLTMFGENTPKAREKFQQEIEETHDLFKQFITQHRQLDMEKVATGEHWYGSQALALELVDQIQTSDDYLLEASHTHDIYLIEFIIKADLKHWVFSLLGMNTTKLLNLLKPSRPIL